ncbi:MAG TPA: hypothetical protein ENJ01_06560 [Gammaproteobacteria bacterium]|nr:hypothetical protein [Gammaproteobacteria bacterium]
MKISNRFIMGSALSIAAIGIAIDHTRHRLPEVETPAAQAEDVYASPCSLEDSPCSLGESPCSLGDVPGESPCSLEENPCSLGGVSPCSL